MGFPRSIKRLLYAIVAVPALWCATAAVVAAAEPLDLAADAPDPVGLHMSYIQEGDAPLSLEQAHRAYEAGQFQPARHSRLSFGIGANPVWLAFVAENSTPQSLNRRILIECSWLDQIDLFFLRRGEVIGHQRVGDTLPFAERPVRSRYFTVPHDFAPETTLVLMRVQSPDPMDLPIYVTSPAQADKRTVFETYSYGFIYGALAALLAYNLMLFLSIRHARYFFYALYLSCFITLNMAYTGHGYWLLWPESPTWQMWSNPVLMVAVAVCGFLFAISFLQTRHHLPRLHRFVVSSIAAFVAMETLAVATGSHVAALLVAFVFVLFFSVVMVWMGVASLRSGLTYAKYFLFAALSAMTGAFVTAVTVWGLVPYTVLGYRLMEVGIVLDAVLLALALADQFRTNMEQKARAERLARIDPLTGLNNRRGFYELAAPAWSTGLRHKRSMSVIVLDLDHFKAFNDAYGHAKGDEMLKLAAHEFQRMARAGDVAARWGGEEFILFLPETTLDEAASAAARLRNNINAVRLECCGQTISVTASCGVAELQDPDIGLEGLIDLADQRLYTAKQQGRDRVCAA